MAALASANFKDGWLLGQSGELILWVPAEYRAYLRTDVCTLVVGEGRVIIEVDDSGRHAGKDWARCWRGGMV